GTPRGDRRGRGGRQRALFRTRRPRLYDAASRRGHGCCACSARNPPKPHRHAARGRGMVGEALRRVGAVGRRSAVATEVPLIRMLTPENTAEYQRRYNLSYHVHFAQSAQTLVGLRDRTVLEIGGSLPEGFVREGLG